MLRGDLLPLIGVFRSLASIVRILWMISRISVFKIARMIIVIAVSPRRLTPVLAITAVATVIAVFARSVRCRLETTARLFRGFHAAVLKLR